MSPVIRRYTIHAPQLEGRTWDEARQELQRFLRYLMDANDSGQEGAGIVGVVDGGVDHGSIGGLLDDDHTQYLKEKASGGTAGEIPLHDHSSGAQAGQVDHGALTGLTDDDHTQYLKERLSGGAEAEVPGHSHQAVASAGQLDHGLALTGLGDDDHTQYQLRTEKGAASGYASLDASSVVVEKVGIVRQGLVGALPALAEGELYWATDTDTLYIGT